MTALSGACHASGTGRPAELMYAYIVLSLLVGLRTEEIARLVGHTTTRTTEIVYRRELRLVITTGAEIMDKIFKASQSDTAIAVAVAVRRSR